MPPDANLCKYHRRHRKATKTKIDAGSFMGSCRKQILKNIRFSSLFFSFHLHIFFMCGTCASPKREKGLQRVCIGCPLIYDAQTFFHYLHHEIQLWKVPPPPKKKVIELIKLTAIYIPWYLFHLISCCTHRNEKKRVHTMTRGNDSLIPACI